jgi:hypothetical protein
MPAKKNKLSRIQRSIMMPPHIVEAMENLAGIEQGSLSQQVTLASTQHLNRQRPSEEKS